MLIINNLHKLDPQHWPTQPDTKPQENRAAIEKPVLFGRFMPSGQKSGRR
jgi:hypothetical protein